VKVTNTKSDGALGMTVAIFRVPSCLEINFNLLDEMKANKVYDYYEVRNFNSDIAFYWRQFKNNEAKDFNLDFLQAFAGECYQQPHNAYLYYNNDQPKWSKV